MEPSRESPWAEHEKVYLLAEIIKASHVPSDMLYSYIRERQIIPQWTEIALPPGRPLRSCQAAFGDLVVRYEHEPRPPPPLASPALFPVQDLSRKRPLPPDVSTPTGRLLQPRPPHPFMQPDQYGAPIYQIAQVGGEPSQKKKRGRPTKAEAQARADAAAARGEVYPPPSNRKKASRPSLGSVGGGEGGPSTATVGPAAAAPIEPERPGTPQISSIDVPSGDSSSGKRRRGRPTRLDLGDSQIDPSRPLQDSPTMVLSVTRPDSARALYTQPTSASEERSPAIEHRDVQMEGIEEYSHQTSRVRPLAAPTPYKQQQQQSQPPQQQQPIPPPPQTSTPHSFKETVGM